MRQIGWALAMVWACGVPAGAASAQQATRASTALEAAVDRAAAELLRQRASAGFAITVADRNGVILSKGYGLADLEHAVPVTPDTVFRIGSITKEFTAAAILLLAERGKLSVDDRLSAYFPDFPGAGEVTLRELLNHTSGIGNYTNAENFLTNEASRPHTTAEMVALIEHSRPLYDFAPGTAWNYSNSGYFLLGAIVEKVSGQPLAAFLKGNIFDPLGLANTRLDDLAEIVPDRAAGYDKVAAAPDGFANTSFISLSVAEGAGAIRSTARDLVRWHAALLGGRLLKPASLRAMTRPGLLGDGRPSSAAHHTPPRAGEPASEYGFGLMLDQRDGRRTIGHGGSINGFSASLLTYPESGLTVAVLSNTTGAAATLVPALTAEIRATRSARN